MKKNIVKLLDDPARFKAIKTGIKKVTQLNHEEQQKYRTYLNAVKRGDVEGIPDDIDTDTISWVSTYRNELESYIIDKYEQGKKNTYSAHTGMLAKLLLGINKNLKEHKDQARRLLLSSVQVKKDDQVNRDKSIFTERELKNIICYPELLKLQKKMETEWNRDLKNKRKNLKHLLLALVTLVPPLRRTYEMKVVKKKPDDDDNNYLWKKSKNKYVFVINRDKVSERGDKDISGRTEFDLSIEIPGVTNGKRLNKIIEKSLLHYPRGYLFPHTQVQTASMTANNISTLLKSVSKKLNINLIRKIYVNHFYRQDHSVGTLKLISSRMRHDHRTAMDHYYKINYKCFTTNQNNILAIMNQMTDDKKKFMDEHNIKFDKKTQKYVAKKA